MQHPSCKTPGDSGCDSEKETGGKMFGNIHNLSNLDGGMVIWQMMRMM